MQLPFHLSNVIKSIAQKVHLGLCWMINYSAKNKAIAVKFQILSQNRSRRRPFLRELKSHGKNDECILCHFVEENSRLRLDIHQPISRHLFLSFHRNSLWKSSLCLFTFLQHPVVLDYNAQKKVQKFGLGSKQWFCQFISQPPNLTKKNTGQKRSIFIIGGTFPCPPTAIIDLNDL